MSEIRPLPPRPSLEFERKEAKALLRQLRAGDPDAMARAKVCHSALNGAAPERFRLADAQLVIAREYGFASWPRLVRYFGDIERVLNRTPSGMNSPVGPANRIAESAGHLLVQHKNRRPSVARVFAAYVPRFYGLRVEEVFELTPTEDEARLACARRSGVASWNELLERADGEARLHNSRRANRWEATPDQLAWKAIESADLLALQRVAEAHPQLLAPTPYERSVRSTLLATALHQARTTGQERMRPIIDWLESLGFDLQRELNVALCGHMYMKPDEVQQLLEEGADPDWVAPNGYTVLEHAVVRYWSDEALDVIAARARPRRSLWMAAGLDDVDGVRSFLDRHGRPTAAARAYRPDFASMGGHGHPMIPDAEDTDILTEAFVVALLNRRTKVLEYMISRGFPVDTLEWEMPFVAMAVGNRWTSVVECLVRCGANLDLRGAYNGSAREHARENLEQNPQDQENVRIAELCGLDADAIVTAHNAKPLSVPTVDPRLQDELNLAVDDARRLGQPDVRAENLLFGMLRKDGLPLMFYARVSGMDFERFGRDFAERLRHGETRVDEAPLPLSPEAQDIMNEATAIAAGLRRQNVRGDHVLGALLRQENGIAAELLTRYGSSAEKLLEKMSRSH